MGSWGGVVLSCCTMPDLAGFVASGPTPGPACVGVDLRRRPRRAQVCAGAQQLLSPRSVALTYSAPVRIAVSPLPAYRTSFVREHELDDRRAGFLGVPVLPRTVRMSVDSSSLLKMSPRALRGDLEPVNGDRLSRDESNRWGQGGAGQPKSGGYSSGTQSDASTRRKGAAKLLGSGPRTAAGKPQPGVGGERAAEQPQGASKGVAGRRRSRGGQGRRRKQRSRRYLPIRDLLKRLRALRGLDPDGTKVPPDWRILFKPNPVPIDEVSGVVEDVYEFWSNLRKLATFSSQSGALLQRKPLLYLLASTGRGKTRRLLEAALVGCAAAAGFGNELSGTVILGVSYNGEFSLRPEEIACVVYPLGYYLPFYLRLLYSELAIYGRNPKVSFGAFVTEFYADLKDKRFSVADVKAEVIDLVTRRASRGGPLSKVVVLVDELNCLSTSAVGASICAALKMDIRHPIRSETCAMTDLVGGVSVFTSLDAGLMLAEKTASGRSAELLQQIESPRHKDLVGRMYSALCGRKEDPKDLDRRLMVSMGSVRMRMKAEDCAEVYALASGTSWRTAVLTRDAIGSAGVLNFFDVVRQVMAYKATGPAGTAVDGGATPPTDLWSVSVEVRDAVLAAVILSRIVKAAERVVPLPASGMGDQCQRQPLGGRVADADKQHKHQPHDAEGANASESRMAEVKTEDWGANADDPHLPQVKTEKQLDQERADYAREMFRLALARRDIDLHWGDIRALGYVTAGGNKVFVPDFTAMSLIHGLDQSTSPSPLWKALQDVVTVVDIEKPGMAIDQVTESPDETATRRKKLVGAAWEKFVMVGERVHSFARCKYPEEYSSITLAKLLGQRAAYVGNDPVLQEVRVNAAIPHKRVWEMTGKACAGEPPNTVEDLLSKEHAEDLWDAVYLFPPNTVRLDGVFFLRICPSSTGHLRDGYVMVLVQSKTRGATALPDVNTATILEKLHELEPKLVVLIGGQERYDYWLSRSCYMHVVDGELTQSDKRVAAGSWSERAIIRTRDDLPFLFGRMLFSVGRIIGLVDEALILNDHDR